MMKNVKKLLTLLSALMVIFLIDPSQCKAEKIYCKDGKIVSGSIIYRSRNSVWIKYGPGSIGVATQSIDRIENEDGSISKYDYESACNLIQNYIKEDNYNKAIKLCSDLLGSFPDDAQLRYLRAIVSQGLGNPEDAIEDYNFLIEHGIADAEIFNNLGAIYAYDKEYKKASDSFSEAIAKDPYMLEAYYNLAQLSMQTEDYGRAIDEYRKVIHEAPEDAEALHNLGIAYMGNGDYLNAKKQWNHILTIKPDDAKAKKALEYLDGLN